MNATLHFRRAGAGDAAALTSLAMRSKAYWGYDAAFLARVAPALTQAAEQLAERDVIVAETAGALAGFYTFATFDGALFLDDLWVDPPFIGRGIGRALWEHAVAHAEAARVNGFWIESDPNAEAFYVRMGARRAGERVSPHTGRALPLLRFDIGAGPPLR